MTACSGKCGREGAGPYDSGQPDLDRRYTWCDECWGDLHNKRMPPGLVKDVPPGTLVPFGSPAPSGPQLNSMARTEHKILAAECKTVATITATSPGATDNGTFSGYLAAFGRDHGGDQIMPGAMDETAAALNSGAIQWHLTDAHSEKASDVVATVRAAAVDHHGLRIEGAWMPTERAQALRQMVRNGAKLGLSIDYLTDASRPDGKGGRLLDRITVVGGAVTPKPMNAAATITEGKAGAWAPVIAWGSDAQAQAERSDPQRQAEDRLLAAASWPPQHWGRELRLSLIRGAAEAKARREIEGDYERARAQARREQQNRYSSDLAAWMAANR
jgi:hypothetical protein